MDPIKRTPFRTLCRCLTGALGQPLTAADLPANPTEWEKVLRLSSAHLVTPQLRWALREQGLFSTLPNDVAEYLDAIYTLNLEKNDRCIEQLVQFVQALNSVGVQPLLLKGAAVIVGRLYPTSGERIITDLDVLVPAPKLPEILKRLAEIGYQVLLGNGKFAKIGPLLDFPHHHYPPVYHPDWPVTVELHVQPVVLRYGRFLTNEELFRDATSFHCRGADLFLPAPDHLVVHNIIHAFLVDTKDAMRKMSLRQSFELVLASRSYAERIDWGLISQRFDTLGYRLSLRQYLALSNICFGQHLAKEALIESQQQAIIRTYLMRMNLQNRYVNSAINLVCYFIVGSRHLLSHPTRIKRLLNADFYFNLRNVTRRL